MPMLLRRHRIQTINGESKRSFVTRSELANRLGTRDESLAGSQPLADSRVA